MHPTYAPTAPAVGADQAWGARDILDTRLRGGWLVLARAAWIVVAALALGLFVVGVPVELAQLRSTCASTACMRDHLPPADPRALEELGLSADLYAGYAVALNLAIVAVFVAVAALIFWRAGSGRLAWLAAFALLTFGTATFPDTLYALAAAHPLAWPPVAVLNFLGLASFGCFLYLFPDGRFVPRWTRWIALAWIAWQVPKYWLPDWPDHPTTWRAGLNTGIWFGAFGSIVYAQVHRYRQASNAVQRQQTKWVVLGIAAALTAFLGGQVALSIVAPAPTSAGPLSAHLVAAALIYLAVLCIPLSIAGAILRYRLWDIDVIINRTLVYGTLTVSVVGLYMLVVGYLSLLLQARGSPVVALLAAGLVAVVFQPARDRVQRAVNHLLYGERDEPYAVLSRLGQQLEATLAPEAVLPTIVQTVKQALKLPYAAIALKQDEGLTIVTAAGTAVSEPLFWPLIYQHEPVGELLLGPRAPGEGFTPTDRRLLDDLARQASVAAHAVRLTADLQRSRERLVSAREEERRRLRRDLHDGLGPALAALHLQAGVLRTLIARDPAAADALVVELRTDIRAAITSIRRLVYELRPPALDDVGLVAALRRFANGLAAVEPDDGGQPAPLDLEIDAPEDLSALPAAIEVAIYRIVQEALTNVARHARAKRCVVRLAVAEAVHLEITDDGVGLSPEHRTGVGLVSMRERAVELGGTCRVEPAPQGGTRVLVRLPLAKE